MNYKDTLTEKLKRYHKKDIIITLHAYERAAFRNIDLDEVKNNIINPVRLYYAKKEQALKPQEEKYSTYFGYSKTLCHKYVLTINSKCVVCTIIKIKRRWQRLVEKHAKI